MAPPCDSGSGTDPRGSKPSGCAPSGGATGRQVRATSAANRWSCRDRRAHGGREERGHAASRERSRHAASARRAIHGVVAAPAMDVDVDEAGRHDDDPGDRGPAGTRDPSGSTRRPVALDDESPGDDGVGQDEPSDELGGEPMGSGPPPGATARTSAACSAPCTAAPMAPAHVPSSASTTSTRVDRGRDDPPPQLRHDRLDDRAPPALDQPPPRMMRSRRQQRHGVGEADAEVAPDLGEARATPAHRRPPVPARWPPRAVGRAADDGDLVGPCVGFHAAAVAAAAPRPVGVDRLVAQLAGLATEALHDLAAEAMTPPTPVPRVRPMNGRAPPCPEAQLRQPEGARVVDDGRGQPRGRRRPARPPASPTSRRARW